METLARNGTVLFIVLSEFASKSALDKMMKS